MIARPATAPAHGWRLMIWGHHAQKPRGSEDAAPSWGALARSRRLRRPTRGPISESAAGIVSEASITSSTARTDAIARPVEKSDAERELAEQSDHDGDPREQDGAPGGIHRAVDRRLQLPARAGFSRKRVTMKSA